MVMLLHRFSRKAGLPPGTLVHVGEQKVEKTRIRVIDYDDGGFEEKELLSIDECLSYRYKNTVSWVNIDGLHDLDVIRTLGEGFGFHSLVLEDVVNTGQRPKCEDYDDYLFVSLKMLFYDNEANRITAEQVSLVLGENYVVSFQEREGDVFDPVRERLRRGKGRIRKRGADYLAYTLIDAIVDNYFTILEKTGEKIESIEESLMGQPKPEDLQMVFGLKREMLLLRRSVWPVREAITGLQKGESKLIHENTVVFLRDVHDHTIQLIETLEIFQEIVTGMVEVYLSSVSNQMNQTMKVLTVIATIFIPLTFVAGIYGMNFKYMPELEWHWGYPAALGIMIGIVLFMIGWFRRKRFI